MTGSVASLVPFAAIVTFVYYILARAEITRLFWEGPRRALDHIAALPPDDPAWGTRRMTFVMRFWTFLDSLLSCPMCSGWWIGLAFGWTFDLPVSAWAVRAWSGLPVVQILAGGIYGLVLCPVVLGAMYRLRHQEAMEHYAAENVRGREQDTGALMGRFDEILSVGRALGNNFRQCTVCANLPLGEGPGRCVLAEGHLGDCVIRFDPSAVNIPPSNA